MIKDAGSTGRCNNAGGRRSFHFFLTDWIQEHARSELSSSEATTGWSGAPESEDYRRRIFVKPAAEGTPLRAPVRSVSIGSGSS